MRYFWLILKHKWFVFFAGLRTKAPIWRLLTHDLSKLTPAELFAYDRQFFGKEKDSLQFAKAWLHHQNVNPHHWEYWIPRIGHVDGDPPYPNNEPLPMPMWAVREMVADWLAAGKTYNGAWPDMENWIWLKKAHRKMRLHPITQDRLRVVLYEIGAFEGARLFK